MTIGIDDLKKSLKFYRDGLGLNTDGIVGEEFEYGAVAFFNLQSGVKLAVYPRKILAKDAGIKETLKSSTELSIGHNVGSEKEVDAVMRQAKKAGAKIIKPAQKLFGVGMPDTLPIRTVIYGKLFGIRLGKMKVRNERICRQRKT